MDQEKLDFLRRKFVSELRKIDPNTPPAWGKMNFQQMVEHFSGDALRNANGKLKIRKLATPQEHLQRARDFMMSEKPFRENTKNPLLGEEPAALRNSSVEAAITELEEELKYFFEVFEKQPGLTTFNPIFGDLNFAQNVHLLHKHAIHHLKQFGKSPLI